MSSYLDGFKQDFAEYDAMDHDFIDDGRIWAQLNAAENPTREQVRAVLKKAHEKIRLDPEETAILLQNNDPVTIGEMFDLALRLKKEVYGDRIVFFAPLYISDECANNCKYCGFRSSNHAMRRKTLTMDEIEQEVRIMLNEGQKRTVLVYGESPRTNIDFLCESVKKVYSVKVGNGEMRRANINAAPLRREEFRRLHEVGIGTFQVFQETYHHETYARLHPANTVKGHYRWRLYSMDRALEGGVDDVGLGVLFGLYDWRFEVMGLLYHAMHLEEKYNGVGPHTISFPRITPATCTPFSEHPEYAVSDDDFKKLVAILRLSVPYTGLICTAREKPEIRDAVIPLGVSQIDAGTRIGVGGYEECADGNALPDREQFSLGDTRSLDDVVKETRRAGSVPSFCTACYRMGRTGEHFMGVAKSKFVHNFCMPNAIFTYKEYLLDYASPETRAEGEAELKRRVEAYRDEPVNTTILDYQDRMEKGERDLHI